MDQEKIKAIINGIQDLPTLPLVAQKLRDVMDDPCSNASDASRVIEGDQSLVAKVLRLVNSAYYGLPREITKISQAVALLGFRAISQIALSISVINSFDENGKDKFDRGGLWRHSIACAMCCQLLSKKAGYARAEDCFAGGLLHDVGKLVLDQFLHEEVKSILEQTEKKGLSFVEAERSHLGIDHAVIGEWLSRKWKLPLPVVVSIRHHHQALVDRQGFSLSQDLVVDIVRLADTICRHRRIGWNGDSVIPVIGQELRERVDLKAEEVEEVAGILDEEVRKSEIFLALLGEENPERP
jgi:putative nucleotidyltransferase with HDIG domain